MSDLVKRLRIKAGMIEMGEMIAWGSDSALMREAADALELAAPVVQGEPVAYLRKDQLRQVQSKGTMLGDIADSPRADRVPVYTAPQPAEQQPGLAEALRQYQHNDGSGLVFGYDKLLVDQYVAGLAEVLEWLRGAINATPENDKVQAGTWISTKHPRIKQIDAILAAYRKGGEV